MKAPAYYNKATVTAVKGFIVQASGDGMIVIAIMFLDSKSQHPSRNYGSAPSHISSTELTIKKIARPNISSN